MSVELSRARALASGGFGRRPAFLRMLLLSTTIALIGAPARASDVGAPPATEQQQPPAEADQPAEANHEQKNDAGPQPGALSTAATVCEALAAAATTNDLPVDFFTRLIWQESRFKPDAISPRGAQGIAQFMPATAKLNGLENPFDPLEAIAKSGQLLRDLRHEFGNIGLAAAAYNAGPGRVHDWLASGRPLPRETRTYVQFVTGRSVEQWAEGQTGQVDQTSQPAVAPAELVPCNPSASASAQAHADTPKPVIVKPWGVEVVGGPTPAKALARYREWQPKYTALVADRELHVVIRGIIGQMGAARVRLCEDTRDAAQKLCAALKAAGAYCDVLRN